MSALYSVPYIYKIDLIIHNKEYMIHINLSHMILLGILVDSSVCSRHNLYHIMMYDYIQKHVVDK